MWDKAVEVINSRMECDLQPVDVLLVKALLEDMLRSMVVRLEGQELSSGVVIRELIDSLCRVFNDRAQHRALAASMRVSDNDLG